MFERYLVLRCPFGIDGLFGYEAVAPTFYVLVDSVHPAFLGAVPLVVMVGNLAVVVSTEVGKKKRIQKRKNRNQH